MVIFLTSLRHPDNAIDYERVEGLLRLTISSVLGQRAADIAFVVVCNQRPSQVVEDSRVHFHIVDFPAPGIGRSHRLSAQSRARGKDTKLVAGLAYAAMFNPDYVYIFDSDDWLHCDIAAMMLSSSKDVWYSNAGYFIDLPRLKYKTKYGMTRYCGSTFGSKYEFLLSTINANKALTPNASQDEILDTIYEETIEELLGNHSQQVQRFRRSKTRMNQFPFSSVCWVVGTGENRSGTQGGVTECRSGSSFYLGFLYLQTTQMRARRLYLTSCTIGVDSLSLDILGRNRSAPARISSNRFAPISGHLGSSRGLAVTGGSLAVTLGLAVAAAGRRRNEEETESGPAAAGAAP